MPKRQGSIHEMLMLAARGGGGGGGGGRRGAQADLERYRAGYPDIKDDPKLKLNARFYTGAIKSRPEGDTIDAMLTKWSRNHELLEAHHSYIQWLFPIRDPLSMNPDAQPLQLHEIRTISSDRAASRRFVGAMATMLNFYGFLLLSEGTPVSPPQCVPQPEAAASPPFDPAKFTVVPHPNIDHRRTRFTNCIRHMHNDRRITRMLKCMDEMGFADVQALWLYAIAFETFGTGSLVKKADTFNTYWVECVKSVRVRAGLQTAAAAMRRAKVGPYSADMALGSLRKWKSGAASDPPPSKRHATQHAASALTAAAAEDGDDDDAELLVVVDTPAGPSPAVAAAVEPPLCDALFGCVLYPQKSLPDSVKDRAKLLARSCGASLAEPGKLRECLSRFARSTETLTAREVARPMADRLRGVDRPYFILIAPLEAAAAATAKAKEFEGFAKAEHVDMSKSGVLVVAAGWVEAACDDPRSAAALLREYVTLKLPPTPQPQSAETARALAFAAQFE